MFPSVSASLTAGGWPSSTVVAKSSASRPYNSMFASTVRVSRGAIFDVGVDIRRSSPTFGRWAGVVLSADRWNQLYLPEGFAHGFVTLEDATEVSYKVSAAYSADHDRSIRWDDPAIGIDWPITATPIVSARDAAAPALADVETGF